MWIILQTSLSRVLTLVPVLLFFIEGLKFCLVFFYDTLVSSLRTYILDFFLNFSCGVFSLFYICKKEWQDLVTNGDIDQIQTGSEMSDGRRNTVVDSLYSVLCSVLV